MLNQLPPNIRTIVKKQGWNDPVILDMIIDFVRSKGLMHDLFQYMNRIADDEIKMTKKG